MQGTGSKPVYNSIIGGKHIEKEPDKSKSQVSRKRPNGLARIRKQIPAIPQAVGLNGYETNQLKLLLGYLIKE